MPSSQKYIWATSNDVPYGRAEDPIIPRHSSYGSFVFDFEAGLRKIAAASTLNAADGKLLKNSMDEKQLKNANTSSQALEELVGTGTTRSALSPSSTGAPSTPPKIVVITSHIRVTTTTTTTTTFIPVPTSPPAVPPPSSSSLSPESSPDSLLDTSSADPNTLPPPPPKTTRPKCRIRNPTQFMAQESAKIAEAFAVQEKIASSEGHSLDSNTDKVESSDRQANAHMNSYLPSPSSPSSSSSSSSPSSPVTSSSKVDLLSISKLADYDISSDPFLQYAVHLNNNQMNNAENSSNDHETSGKEQPLELDS